MTAFKRIASGSLAMWTRMGLVMLSQVILVPVFLSYWSGKQYGAWLALQSIYSLVTILDSAYQTYLENEFLKIGKTEFSRFKDLLYSSLPCVVFIGLLQLVIFLFVSQTSFLGQLMGLTNADDQLLLKQCAQVLIVWMSLMILTISLSGLLGRALSALGYFSRFAWWGVLYIASSTLLPMVTLMRGGDLLAVGLTQALVIAIYHLFWFWDAIRIMRVEAIHPVKPQLTIAISSLKLSLFVFLRLLLELGRQHGFRLILAPMVGLKKLAEFATQRTIAGVAIQSLNSVYGPMMPELMRYLRERDQAKTNTIFSLIWALTIFLLCPLVYFLQVLMPVVYPIWTRGNFVFDGLLFMTISGSLLIYAISLPAMAICSGNNLVKVQMYVSTIAFASLFVSLPLTIPLLGLRGAALSLMIAEGVSCICLTWNALHWLKSAGLTWPAPVFKLAGLSLGATLALCTLIAISPMITMQVSVVFCVTMAVLGLRFWKMLHQESREYISNQIAQIPMRLRERIS